MSVLLAKNIPKEYHLGKYVVQALDGVNFVVEHGEFVTFMDPSGSGESTLLHLIGSLDNPTPGEITLAGKKLNQLKDKQLTLLHRRNVGFVFQFFNLLPTISAEENIILPVLIDSKNMRKYKDRLDSLFNLLGLADHRRIW